MRRKLLAWSLVVLGLGLAPAVRAENAGMRVIVNAANPIVSLPRAEVARLFLGKSDKWPDGSPASPVDLSGKTATRRMFSVEVLRKELEAVESVWQQLIFTGKAIPPPSKPTEIEAIAFVRQNPGAIAYVSHAVDLGPGVKELVLN